MPVETLTNHFHGLAYANAKNCEANRLKTFAGEWGSVFQVSPFTLAEVGFYSTHNRDEVKCFFCGLLLSGWTGTVKPRDAHIDASPLCPLFSAAEDPGLPGGVHVPSNIPIPSLKSKGVYLNSELNDYLSKLGIQAERGIAETDNAGNNDDYVNRPYFPGVNMRDPRRRRGAQNNLRLKGIPTAADGITVPYTARCELQDAECPLYPDFAVDIKRRNSFYTFPAEKAGLVDPMCSCGFFYTGFSDAVICYQCGVSLQAWRVEKDDPPLVHARWRPSCPLVLRLARFAQRELLVVGI